MIEFINSLIRSCWWVEEIWQLEWLRGLKILVCTDENPTHKALMRIIHLRQELSTRIIIPSIYLLYGLLDVTYNVFSRKHEHSLSNDLNTFIKTVE